MCELICSLSYFCKLHFIACSDKTWNLNEVYNLTSSNDWGHHLFLLLENMEVYKNPFATEPEWLRPLERTLYCILDSKFKRSRSDHRWIWGIHCIQAMKHSSEGSTLASNPKTKSPNQGYQWPYKKGLMPTRKTLFSIALQVQYTIHCDHFKILEISSTSWNKLSKSFKG